MNASAVRAGEAYVSLYADLKRLDASLNSAFKKVQSFANKAASLASAPMLLGSAAAVPMALAVKSFADFDDQMRLTQAVTGATGEQFNRLTTLAKELGRTTSWTASQVASGMVSLGRMGFNSSEIESSIASVMDLARATGTEIGTSTDIAGNTLRQFGLESSEMARVCDVMTTAANSSAQTLEDLGEAMKYAAPIAKAANLSLEDTAVVLASLANFGIKGTMAGTSLRNMLVQLANTGVQDELKNTFGISAVDAEGNLRNLAQVITEIGVAAQKMPNAERLSIFDKLFGKRPLAASAALSTADFSGLANAIANAGNASAKTAQQMDAGVGGSIRLAQSAIEGITLAIADSLAPTLADLSAKIQDSAPNIAKWIEENRGAIVTVTKGVIAVTAFSAAIYATSKAVSFTTGVLSLAKTTINGVSSAVGLLTGATRAATAAAEAEAAVERTKTALDQANLAVKNASTAAEYQAALASQATAAADNAAALSAQRVATATAAKAAAMTTFISVGTTAAAVLAALAAGAAAYARHANKAVEAARAQSDAAQSQSDSNAQLRTEFSQMFARLQALSEKQNLSNQELEEAGELARQLQNVYGNLGIQVDKTARSISGMAEAQLRVNEAQRQQRQADIQHQIAMLDAEARQVKDRQKQDVSPWSLRAMGRDVGSFFGLTKSAEQTRIEDNNRLKDIGLERWKLQNELDMINATSRGAAQDAQAQAVQDNTNAVQDVNNSQTIESIADSLNAVASGEAFNIADEIAQASEESSIVSSEIISTGSFDAFEAFDLANDNAQEEAIKQTQLLEKINTNSAEIINAIKTDTEEFYV